MLIKKAPSFRSSEITPKSIYLNRRRFLAGAPAAFLGARELLAPGHAEAAKLNTTPWPASTSEKVNSLKDITTYNNFYEFGTNKNEPSVYGKNFKTDPWVLSIEGEVGKPRKLSLDDIMKVAPLEERVYRMRCVEAWSIVVPWDGFPLSALLKMAEPTAKAKYVAFESYFSSREMPHAGGIRFPYVEGLRLDEAMHPLTMLAVGLYGETLPPQNGAPVRLVVPWKYGFKGIKSIVKIKLTGSQPATTWNISNSEEYGFYSNVNPEVDHPRWTQASERRLGEFSKRKTLMFNGYGNDVAGLYAGMDLKKNY